MRRIGGTAVLLVILGGAARAQADDPRAALYDLVAVEADHEICGFALSDEQRDVIAQRRDALIVRGEVSEADAATIHDQVASTLQRQRSEGLCRPDGPEARAYKRRLSTLGLL